MRTVDLDNIDLASGCRAIEKAKREKPWCTRDRKDRNVYRVRSRRTRRQRERKAARRLSFVTFIFTRQIRLATCTCDGYHYNAGTGLVCYHIAAAYLKHKRNLEREVQAKKAVAA